MRTATGPNVCMRKTLPIEALKYEFHAALLAPVS
eukprot:CAMPEP_0171212584 /NCGR_PEP_ID=MMETSP0790-20130122/30206_1 /TAXON_ID=2925 /ORGANISM="Alexandrium catenella, Strain OF101" /LENGTH=33 /DNA_ID= /DNA_START= /DNA_END= /DNA_ORIENTATION=